MKQVTILAYKDVSVENCPFCNSDNLDIAGGSGSDTFIRCNNCRCKGPGNINATTATDLWNACSQNKQKEIQAAVATAIAEMPVQTANIKPVSIAPAPL